MVANVRPPFEPTEVTELSASAGMTSPLAMAVADHCDAMNGSGGSDVNREAPGPVIDGRDKSDRGVWAEIGPWPESGESGHRRARSPR